MVFAPSEIAYLTGQRLGRLATVQEDGTLQVSPVGFSYNADAETIDIRGYNLARSQKYRNIGHNGRAAFVVDDVPSVDPWRVRCVEIRGVSGGDRRRRRPVDPDPPEADHLLRHRRAGYRSPSTHGQPTQRHLTETTAMIVPPMTG